MHPVEAVFKLSILRKPEMPFSHPQCMFCEAHLVCSKSEEIDLEQELFLTAFTKKKRERENITCYRYSI